MYVIGGKDRTKKYYEVIWMKRNSLLMLALCTALIVMMFSGCGSVGTVAGKNPEVTPGVSTIAPIRTATKAPPLEGITFPKSYTDIRSTLKEVEFNNRFMYRYSGAMVDMIMEEAEAAPAAPAATTGQDSMGMMESGGGSGKSAEYSDTNVQVKGVDEADIVKTDGEYIYVLRWEEVVILKAAGEDTKIVSRIDISAEDSSKYDMRDMYVSGDKLILIGGEVSQFIRNDSAGNEDWSSWREKTNVDIYDISDRSSPRLANELGQDGYYINSRMIDGTLYLISVYGIYESIDNLIKPGDYVPALYDGAARELINVDCIAIWEPVKSTSYTVISAYDIEDGKAVSNQTVLGGSGEIYMNAENLYLSRSNWEETVSDPYTEDQYTVTDHSSKSTTEISRYSIENGTVSLAATGKVDGYLINQFAMDEYDGNLRVVTTLDSSSYKIYEDEKRGWNQYEYTDSGNTQSNGLYVFDSALNIIGSVEGLGEDERVYSVRFDGEIGYFVTFRQVDPLFAVDLSNPRNPVVLSALKIPGFSQYLHVYGEGRLFGLGMNANEQTGATMGMKLSMFDTSDPANVTEKHTLALSEHSYSEALYNHKAILIVPAKNIIAFPAGNGYAIYSYSDEGGFEQLAYIESEIQWNGSIRGLYIDDWGYVCEDNRVSVLDFVTFKGVAEISFD